MLLNDRAYEIPADFGKTIKPIPVIDRVTDVDVAPMTTMVSKDSIIVFWVLKLLYLFFYFDFCL